MNTLYEPIKEPATYEEGKYFKIIYNIANERRKDIYYKFNTGKDRNKYFTFYYNVKTNNSN
jgi:hypothetical protein